MQENIQRSLPAAFPGRNSGDVLFRETMAPYYKGKKEVPMIITALSGHTRTRWTGTVLYPK